MSLQLETMPKGRAWALVQDSGFPALILKSCDVLVLLKELRVMEWKPNSLFNRKKGCIGQGLPGMALGFAGESCNTLVESDRGFE